MQTFLPLPDFAATAKVLDRERLGKQRVETFQILEALFGLPTRWRHHPAVVMWEGCELTLADYGYAICDEWVSRGYEDNMKPRIQELVIGALGAGRMPQTAGSAPLWLGHVPFHRSHKSNLLRKNPEHYRQFWPDEPDDLPYYWPDPMPVPMGT